MSGPAGPPVSPDQSEFDGNDIYEPKIAETQSKSKSAFSVFTTFACSWNVCWYKRISGNFRTQLFHAQVHDFGVGLFHQCHPLVLSSLCFCVFKLFRKCLVNLIIFIQVNIHEVANEDSANSVDLTSNLTLNSSESNLEAGEDAGGEEDNEEIIISETFHFLNIVLTVISFAHALVSLGLLIAYYQLKVIQRRTCVYPLDYSTVANCRFRWLCSRGKRK